MKVNKNNILRNICYTDLVYGRINKKLGINLTNDEIEEFIFKIINNAQKDEMEIIGKNYYISNYTENIKITINRNTTRIITADKIQNNMSINTSKKKALENKPPVED